MISPARRAALALAVAAAALAAHGGALANGFVWDDEAVVVGNPATRDLRALPRVLMSPDERPPYYRPLNRAAYLVDHAVFGMDPRGFHAVGLALHALASALLTLLALRLLGDAWASALAGLVLAVHPIACEAVSFVTARNNLFALAFSLAAWLAFARAVESRSRAWAALSGTAFLLGLFSKEPAAMLLPLLAGWMMLPDEVNPLAGERFIRRVRWLLPHVAALAVYLVLRGIALSGAPVPVDPAPPGITARVSALGWIVPTYLRLLVWPDALTVFHPAVGPHGALAWTSVAVAWTGLASVVAVQVRRPTMAGMLGMLWAALTLLPASGLVAIPASPVAERFAYLPLAGVALVAGDLALRAVRPGLPRLALDVAAALVFALLAVRARDRTRDWHDDVALFTSAARVNPASRDAWFDLGVAQKDAGDLAGARASWTSALRLVPRDAEAHSQLGTLEAVEGHDAAAEAHLRAALAERPELDQARYNLALILEREGRTAEAMAEYAAVAVRTSRADLATKAAARVRDLAALREGDSRQ